MKVLHTKTEYPSEGFKELACFFSNTQSLLPRTVGLSRGGFTQATRRNRLSQQLVEKLLLSHTNLVLRENLDSVLHNHRLFKYRGTQRLSSMSPNRNPTFMTKFNC